VEKESGTEGCAFCQIIGGEREAPRVFQDDRVLVFLDHRPLFPGHCLVVPREHIETFLDLPADALPALFGCAQRVGRALEMGLEADGSFVAINNRISQSVPHVHVHVIPRRKGDGLKGFFWPRHPYRDPEHVEEVRAKLAGILSKPPSNASEPV
jgi:histidine triad (HIT) family protein